MGRTAGMRGRPSEGILLVFGVLLVAANLRPSLTSVGPLLHVIGADNGLGAPALGLLGAVPLLAFAAVSPLTHHLSGKFGMERSIFAALLVLAAGTVLRPAAGSAAYLWLGTVIIGAAIAVCNVLLPAVLKRDFPDKMSSLTGAYSAVLGGFAAVGAGLAVPIAGAAGGGAGAGWRISLGCWVLLVIPALVLWVPQLKRGASGKAEPVDGPEPERADAPGTAAPAGTPGSGAAGPGTAGSGTAGNRSVWGSAVAWQVTFYMGLQSFIFYVLITWLPSIARYFGSTEVEAGGYLFVFQAIGIGASLATPLMLNRGSNQRLAAALPPVLVLLAALGLMLQPNLLLLWVILAGLASGSSLVTALALFGLRTRTHRQSSALSGMAQSIGYLLAACGPVLVGALYGQTASWLLPLALLGAAAILQTATGLLAGRARFTAPAD